MKSKPKISWIPLRYINPMIDEGKPTLTEWFAQAHYFGLDYVEIYHHLLKSRDPTYLEEVRKLLQKNGLGVSMLTCAPDFTHPDKAERERQLEEMYTNVETALTLGAPGVRVTTGCAYEGVSREDGIQWCVECLKRLADYAEPCGLLLGLENHYRDRRWVNIDFAFHGDVFLEVFDRLKDTPVGVNFDASNQLMVGEDPMMILEVVKHKVWHMHASDRMAGQYQHSVIGEGMVDFDPIFEILSGIGYTGYISLEDGNPEGDAGTQRALDFVRAKVEQYWGK